MYGMPAGGCLFTNGTHVLAGLQVKHGKRILSGFGGKPLEHEDILHAALRETVEELFEIFDVPEAIDDIFLHYIPRRLLENGSYTILVYDFDDLIDFMKILAGHNLHSPLYRSFPMSFQDLLLHRHPSETSEIQQIALVPLDADMELDTAFLSDIALLLAKN